jgi:hypothetical protein
MEEKIIAGLKAKSGRSLEEWVDLIRMSGPSGEKKRAEWLKKEHKVGTNYAGWLASRAEGKTLEYDPDGLVDTMFSGPKAGLLPIYTKLVDTALGFGKDVTITPCKTIVPLRRRYVFAQLKPTTRTRIDLGLALGKTKATGLLIDTGGLAKGDRITHRIPVESLQEIDADVIRWMTTAYEMDA